MDGAGASLRLDDGSPPNPRSEYTDDGALVGQRLYEKGQEMRKRRDEQALRAAEEKLKREQEGLTFRPKIHSAASRSGGDIDKFLSLQGEWLRRRNRQLDKARDKQEREAKAMLSEHPKASVRSERLLKGKQYKGPVEDWERREALFKMAHAEKVPPGTFHPTISPAAMQLRREGDAGERMFRKAQEQRVEQRKAQEQSKTSRDERTGQILFTPVTRRNTAAQHSPNRRTEDERRMQVEEMLKKAQEAERKLAKKRKEVDRDQQLTFKPELNVRSQQILSRAPRVPIHLRKEEPRKSDGDADQTEPPGSQQRRRPQEELDAAAKEFFERTRREKQKLLSRIGKLRDKQEQAETKECSFRPKISAHSSTLARQRALQGYVPPGAPAAAEGGDAGSAAGSENIFYAADVAPGKTPQAGSRRSASAAQAPPGDSSAAGSSRRLRAPGSGSEQPRITARRSSSVSHSDPTRSAGVTLVSPPRMPALGADDSFAQWEEEWQRQQLEIDAALRVYEDATHPGSGSSSGGAAGHQLSPPGAAGGALDAQLDDLQEVLDGWRQLEQQFAVDFDRLQHDSTGSAAAGAHTAAG
eukprot:TRINITY_DN50688_c0_g1_i1.p1 TRINITY_DN50688_c0_g1~~TRINITY_DN50688_c0_g1_i1.p1  ORF type:complete len:608 (+),score=249.94 TRINITY_DN50688_c0_g1_i1:75-1826(+)